MARAVTGASVLSGIVIIIAAGDAGAQDPVLTLDEIVVEGSQVQLAQPYAGGQVATGGRAGLLGNNQYADLPFSGTAYTAELIENQQADSIGDVLLNDPTVRVASGFGNFQELYLIRGFPVFSDDITLNGLYGILPRQYVAAPLVERVEVLRGANAFVNGAAPGNSAVGGTVNLVPKRASVEGETALTLGYESTSQILGTVDVGRRFGADSEWGMRVGATGRIGERAVENEDRRLGALSVGVDYEGAALRFAADLGYQDNYLEEPRPQVTPLGAVPDEPDADQNYAQPWTFSEEQQLFFAARGEIDLTEQVSGWLAGGFRLGDEANSLANPNADAAGNLTAFRFDNVREDTVFSGDGGVRAEFATGPVAHRVTLSGSATHADFKNAFAFSDFAGFGAGTLDNPLVVAPPPATAFLGGDLGNPLTTEQTTTSSVAIADTLSAFDDRVLLTVGGRFQWITTKAFDATSGALTSEADASALTPVVGLVVKPFDGVSVYANYAEALQRPQIAPAVSGGLPVLNAGDTTDPFLSQQIELGAKYDQGSFGVDVAVFAITQAQAVVENQIFSANGEQRNRGVELTIYGEPIEGLRVIGGATYVDAKLQKTQGGINDGRDAVGVPEIQANLGVEWAVPFADGLTVDGRVIYTGEQFVNAANTFAADGWARFDLGARYDTVIADTPVTLRARVENVADTAYWASVGGFPGANYLVQGAPRTFMASATLKF